MVRRYISFVCQCVIDDLYKRYNDINYLSDSLIFNDYHGLRNNCTCRSGNAHSFGYIYYRRHKELLIKFFSYDTCKTASKFCFHRPTVACNECSDFYNLYYLKDSIKICVSILMLFERYSRHVKLLNYVEAQNFFQTCRKIKQDGNEQVDQKFYDPP